MIEIKVAYCLAYDWEMLKISLPLVYPYSDKICLSIDLNRVSWSGNRYNFDETQFSAFVQNIDVDKKISLFEEDFFLNPDDPMKNEVYQRNKIGEFMGESGWHVQLDVDEYPIDMKGFTSFLRNSYHAFGTEINICLPWLTLFKKIENGFLIVKGETEWIQIASKKPHYMNGRRNGYANYKADFPLLHQSWAREEDAIQSKLKNWGHKNDFDSLPFFSFWKELKECNYQTAQNFHPLIPTLWKSLVKIEVETVADILREPNLLEKFNTYSKAGLWLHQVKFYFKADIHTFKKKLLAF